MIELKNSSLGIKQQSLTLSYFQGTVIQFHLWTTSFDFTKTNLSFESVATIVW